MTEREKVIAAVECCFHLGSKGCRSCPYVAEVDFEKGCVVDLAGRIIAQLKEQEARVMDDALLLEYDGAVWLENKRDTGTILSICKSADDRQFRFFSKNEWENVAYLRENYGKTWRCWTSRPTDKQRKAVAWDA